MNISPVNGFDLKTNRSIELQSEVEKFLKSGGKKTELPCNILKRGEKYDASIYTTGKKGTKVKKTVKNPEKMADAKEIRNKKIAEAFASRKAIQIPLLKEYESWKLKSKWKVLSRLCEVSDRQLEQTCRGDTTVANKDKWQGVVEAIEKLRKELKK